MNLLYFPSLLLCVVFYKIGALALRKSGSRAMKTAVFLLGFALSVPGLLLFLYYFHIFDHSEWYFEWRTIMGTELSGAGLGFLTGALVEKSKNSSYAKNIVIIFLFWLLTIPFAKTMFAPFMRNSFEDKWRDGVCIQTTSASCGPCSAATLLRHNGENATEGEIARDSFTYFRGTEAWYLARAIQKRGYDVDFVLKNASSLDEVPIPSIAGTIISNGVFTFGHFISILQKDGDFIVIADSIDGKHRIPKEEFFKQLRFTGFFMKINKRRE